MLASDRSQASCGKRPLMHALDFAVCATATALILWALIASGLARRLALDFPNPRSLHDLPTPRVGGLALIPVALGWMAARQSLPTLVLVAAASLSAISFADDRRGLSMLLRLGAQIACAAVVLAATPGVPHGWIVVLLIATVWMTNAYNFMDGSDGLAGGMALIGFCSLGLAALQAGNDALAAASAALAGAAAGFLLFNFPPARVFLGDAGSIPLGFLSAVIGLRGVVNGSWPVWFPILVFSPFLADASLTLMVRISGGEPIWRAHREHVYQRMVAAGLGRRITAVSWYSLMLVAGACAIALLRAGREIQNATLITWAIAYPTAFLIARRTWRL